MQTMQSADGGFHVMQKNTFLEVVDERQPCVAPRGRSTMSEPSRSRECTPTGQGTCGYVGESPELNNYACNTQVWNPQWQQESQYNMPMWVPSVAYDQQGQPMQAYCVAQPQWVEYNGQPMQVTFIPYDNQQMYCNTQPCGEYDIRDSNNVSTAASTQNPSSAGSDTLEDDVRRWRGDEMLLGDPRQYDRRGERPRGDKDKKHGDGKKRKGKMHKHTGGKVFVGGLASKTTEETLLKVFSKFGEVVQANILLDPQSRRSRGFGYVCFAGEIPEGVSGADHNIDGRMCGARAYKY